MKSINITFEDAEFEELKTRKITLSKKLNKQINWKNFLLESSKSLSTVK